MCFRSMLSGENENREGQMELWGPREALKGVARKDIDESKDLKKVKNCAMHTLGARMQI